MPAWAWWGLIAIGLFAVGWLCGRRRHGPAGHGPWDPSWAVYFSPNGGVTHAILLTHAGNSQRVRGIRF
jgi:hypothetical protein